MVTDMLTGHYSQWGNRFQQTHLWSHLGFLEKLVSNLTLNSL